MKTDEAIKIEIQTLVEIKPKVRHYTAFNDDNHAAIDAQIEALEQRMTEDDVYETFEDDQRLLDEALEASHWMTDDPDSDNIAPSDSWKELIEP